MIIDNITQKLAYHEGEEYIMTSTNGDSCDKCSFNDDGDCTRKYRPTLLDGTEISCSDHSIIFKRFKKGKKKLLII